MPKSPKTIYQSGRTLEQLKNHYEVEKSLAKKLLNAPKEARKKIVLTMYDELFEKVPDHPRLTRREDPESTEAYIKDKYRLIGKHLNSSVVFLDFAPGDCKFAYDVCKRVNYVYGIDISDQRAAQDRPPANFKHIIYDGYSVDIGENTIDVAFSDQLLEHLHPDDMKDHLKLALRVLRPWGIYLFRTPHNYSGPHDISGYFSDIPEGFHLKEWTFTEFFQLMKTLPFSSFSGCLMMKGRRIVLPYYVLMVYEYLLALLPKKFRKALCTRILCEVIIIAKK